MSETNYKETLTLPKTDFPMRGQLPQREPERLHFWDDKQIYEKMLQKNAGKKRFTMPDGPPYANGNIHLGHVLNKVLKDIVVKYKNMSGQQAAFIPGWDCHGLPIELAVTKKHGKKEGLTDEKIRTLCRQEAMSWVQTQREQFQRLGIMADWENPYLTLQPEYEAEEVRELARLYEKGILYRGEKPVYWCIALQTALAEAEVEYASHKSPSIYVKFDLDQVSQSEVGQEETVSLVIWTTTPWTLPANLAVAVHPEFKYGLYRTSKGLLIIAEELKENFEEATGLKLEFVKGWQGSELENLKAQHPFIERTSQVILGTHVTLEAGTGCVHTAPGHGQEDYIVGQKYGLDVYSPVDEKGCYTSDVPRWEGVNVFKANPLIVEELEKTGHLLTVKEIEHSYPHCWRSKTPLIFRATPQWFLRMDDTHYNVRVKALESLKKVDFYPDWGRQRLQSMIENRPDWCLSRQRKWGVPIPAFYCQKCDEALLTPELIFEIADLMEENNGIEAYFQTPTAELVGDRQCSCGHDQFNKGEDILDVWFDSGICHAAVQKRREALEFPADIYLEGSDQHRGWFQTSLLSSIASNDAAPFKALVTHGFVNDAQGRKMSKSLGNVIDPQKISKQYGAEILRLWVSYEDYGQDLTCGEEKIKRVIEAYRRFRNTMRFLLGNLNEFDPNKDKVAYDQLTPLDQWALGRLQAVIEKAKAGYEDFNFYKVYHALNQFATVDLSATYMDILKDRLYTWKKDGLERRASQTVLYEVLTSMLGIMAPILSFLAEETYTYLPGSRQESVFLTTFPTGNGEWKNEALMGDFEKLFSYREEISKELESLRQNKVIGSSLEATVTITATKEQKALLEKYFSHLPEFFIVSDVELQEGKNNIQCGKAAGDKCPRCWNFSTKIGSDSTHPDLCPKCVKALS